MSSHNSSAQRVAFARISDQDGSSLCSSWRISWKLLLRPCSLWLEEPHIKKVGAGLEIIHKQQEERNKITNSILVWYGDANAFGRVMPWLANIGPIFPQSNYCPGSVWICGLEHLKWVWVGVDRCLKVYGYVLCMGSPMGTMMMLIIPNYCVLPHSCVLAGR